jgi:hypothetical protein
MRYLILALLFILSLSGCAELIGQPPDYYYENVNNAPEAKRWQDTRKCEMEMHTVPTYGRQVDRDTQKQTFFYACMANQGWILRDKNLMAND